MPEFRPPLLPTPLRPSHLTDLAHPSHPTHLAPHPSHLSHLSHPIAPIAPSSSLEDVVSRSIPAIVSIEAGQGRGSGFFAAPRTVITNRHVVQNNVDGHREAVERPGAAGHGSRSTSQEYDLAIVRVDSAMPSQPVLPLGTVNEVRPGQEVIAIGLALGVFQNSVTRGIISAVRRADRTVMLQTDAAINPGNSGGPLLNRSGQVVGINTMKITGAAESLGFAVAVDHARSMLGGGGRHQQLCRFVGTAQPAACARVRRRDRRPTPPAKTVRGDTRRSSKARRAGLRSSIRYWDRIKANCGVRVAPGYDREWFGLWDGRTSLTSPDSSCVSAVSELERSRRRSANGDGRRAGRGAPRVGAARARLREIRRRHRMDWPG